MKTKHYLFIILTLISAAKFSFAQQLPKIGLQLSTSSTFLEAGRKQVIPLKINLSGFRMLEQERPPINVAIVIDKSGSMSGAKIAHARKAAIMALNLLDNKDIVSIIAYDDQAKIIVPATRINNRNSIIRSIENIMPGGGTALFAGVSQGVYEVRKFFDKNSVNRVILISDGLANVGPSSPQALGELGYSLGREGISVTTIGLGLGYNEDLMSKLAGNSDGNHAFAENSRDLDNIFQKEFQDLLSVIAKEIEISIHLNERVRPVRVVGREADISGQNVFSSLNQLYASQNKYLLLEVEVPAMEQGSMMNLADVKISYDNLHTKKTDIIAGALNINFTESKQKVLETVDKETIVSYEKQIANQQKEKVIELRDRGMKDEAQNLLKENAVRLKKKAEYYKAPSLSSEAEALEEEATQMDSLSWGYQRKAMTEKKFKTANQQNW